MDDKPLDLSKKSDTSTTESEFPSSEKPQRTVKEEKQNPPSNIAFSSREDFSKSVENSRRTTQQESMKSVRSRPRNKESKILMYENVSPGSRVKNKRKISAGLDINRGTKRNRYDESASNAGITNKFNVVYDPDCTVRATEDYSSRPSTSTDATCSYDPTGMKDHSVDHYKFPFVCEYCEYCTKGFEHRSKYDIHVRSHTGETPFECDHCDKRFTALNKLRVHNRVHTGERPFWCQKSGKSFNRSHHLTDHVRIHTGEKPYSCPICGKDFALKRVMRKHEKIHKGKPK